VQGHIGTNELHLECIIDVTSKTNTIIEWRINIDIQ